MPRHKQPNSLAVLALRSVADFVLKFGKDLIRTVCSDTKTDVNQVSSYNWNALQCFLHPGLPHSLAKTLISVLLKAVATLTREAECVACHYEKGGHEACLTVIENIITSAVHPRICKELILQNSDFMNSSSYVCPDFMCVILCKHLDRFTSLKVLKLRSGYRESAKRDVWFYIINNIGFLENLVEFSYFKNCTDNILKVVGQNCKLLEHLNVVFSKQVTSVSVDSIIKLSKLKTLNIWGTFIDRQHCSELLSGLPCLEIFVSDQEDIIQGMNKCKLRLKSLTTRNLSSPHQLVQMCPYLTRIFLYGVNCELSQLATLTSLQEIQIHCCDFSSVQGLLLSKHNKIVSLKLYEVSDTNINNICCCTQLKTLILAMCTYSLDRMNTFDNFSSPHYKTVENVEVYGYYPRNFDVLLSAYINLKTLIMARIHNFKDEIIPITKLKNLEVVKFTSCGYVKIETLKSLVDSCDNLRKIVYLSEEGAYFDGLPALKAFKKYIKENNLDIELCIHEY